MVRSELRTKIGERVEAMRIIEALLVFPVAALYFAVVAGCVWTDQFVSDSKARGGQLKACGQISSAVGKTVGEFESVVCLHTLYPHATAFEPGHHFLQEIGRRIGALLSTCTR